MDGDYEAETDQKGYNREYFVKLVDDARNEDDVADIITFISTLVSSVEDALPSLCLLADKVTKEEHKAALRQIAYCYLRDPQSTKGGRKACYACLKQFPEAKSPGWEDFFVLAETLGEPQFHLIKPVLGRMDSLIRAVQKGLIDVMWAELVLTRGLLHTNGWIRLWALEKSVVIDSSLFVDSAFLFDNVFPALNNNDLLWRLLERGRLTSFVDALGSHIEQIINLKSIENQVSMVRSILQSIESLSCSVSLYYVATALRFVKPRELLGEESDFALIRRVLIKLQYMSYPVLKTMTIYNLIRFFSMIVVTSSRTAIAMSSLTASFSRDAPSLLDTYLKEMPSFKQVFRWKKEEDFSTAIVVELIAAARRNIENDDFYRLVWQQAAENDEQQSLLHKQIALAIAERLVDTGDYGNDHWTEDMKRKKQRNAELDNLMAVYLYSPIAPNEDEALKEMITGHLLYLFATRKGKPMDFVMLDRVHLPLLRKCSPQTFSILLPMITPLILMAHNSEKYAYMSCVIRAGIEYDDENNSEGKKIEVDERLLKTKKILTTSDEMPLKEYRKIVAILRTNEMNLLLRSLNGEIREIPEAVRKLNGCLEELDRASSYSVKKMILKRMEILIEQVSDEELQYKTIQAANAVVDEEKKSINSLPALRQLFKLGFQKRCMSSKLVAETVEELFDEALSRANMNVSIALVLARLLDDSKDLLSNNWASAIAQLAIFGPVPKKENRVQYYAYKEVCSGPYSEDFQIEEQNRLHETVQRTRMISLNTAIELSEKNPDFATSIIEELLKVSFELDKSTSRSFGLSLAHRQNTRIVAVLLFITDHVKDMVTLEKLFARGIDWLVDPCQQFSIKLIVEWLLVRLALRLNEFKEKLIGLETELATRRIGSVSSWLNMLAHIGRAEKNQETSARLLELIVPWTTAQNFPVRCTAVAAARLLYAELPETEKEKWKIVKAITQFDKEPAGNSRRVIDNLTDDFYFANLDVNKHFSLETALELIPEKTGMPEDEIIPRHLILELNRTSIESLNSDEELAQAPSLVFSALAKNSMVGPEMDLAEDEGNDEHEASPRLTEGSYQRKIATKTGGKKQDCSMIVVASLVDKTSNLGGLCRTSEIFGVDSLVISDLKLAEDTSFKALSMSSENWQKMEAVRPDDLLPYLESLRKEGYVVIAAEQTTDSVPMHKFTFPKKCVLLVGDEREGVPTKLLRCVDRTVEIEQLGQTRSLNVHVTAALFIAKYAEQILLD